MAFTVCSKRGDEGTIGVDGGNSVSGEMGGESSADIYGIEFGRGIGRGSMCLVCGTRAIGVGFRCDFCGVGRGGRSCFGAIGNDAVK